MGPFEDGWTRADVERVIERDDPTEVLYVPIIVGMNAPDCGAEWAEEVCIRLAAHMDPRVRANAQTGLGHVVRTVGQISDNRVFTILEQCIADEDAQVRANARDAIEDLRVFIRDASASEQVAKLLRLARAHSGSASE
jgi:hypothetical protein